MSNNFLLSREEKLSHIVHCKILNCLKVCHNSKNIASQLLEIKRNSYEINSCETLNHNYYSPTVRDIKIK